MNCKQKIKKILYSEDRKYMIEDLTKDFHSKDGMIKVEDLKKKSGTTIKTNTGTEFYVIDADWLDNYKKIKRLPQIMTLKDLGVIFAYTNINKKSIVLEAGCGSGALTCFFGRYAKKIIAYDIEEKNLKVAKENCENLGIKNVKFVLGDVRKKISEKNIDVVVLDMPDPENASDNVNKCLKVGGYLVIYVPNLIQTQIFLEKCPKSLINEKNIEVIQRPWVVKGRVIRPSNQTIGHTAFLSFFRKVF